jgi:hypothetical protein
MALPLRNRIDSDSRSGRPKREVRRAIPPPGPQMAFGDWATAIVAGVRRYLPAARAARRGRSHVIIRHDGREAHLRDEGSVCTITFAASSLGSTMASLSDQRRDAFTARNLAESIAGFLMPVIRWRSRSAIE